MPEQITRLCVTVRQGAPVYIEVPGREAPIVVHATYVDGRIKIVVEAERSIVVRREGYGRNIE